MYISWCGHAQVKPARVPVVVVVKLGGTAQCRKPPKRRDKVSDYNCLTFLFEGKMMLFSPVPFSTIGHGDKDTVDMVKGEESYHTMRYDKDMARTGVRLEFPHMVKFQTDSCLE